MRRSVLCSAAVLAGVVALKIQNSWQQKPPGTKASHGQFPHVAILRGTSTKEHFCSGAIVGNRSILTAAHCVDELELESFEIVVGMVLNDATPNQQNVHSVANVTIHPEYQNLANDIAIVHTVNDIRQSDNVKIIELGINRNEVGSKLYATGWSRYEVNEFRFFKFDCYFVRSLF